MNRSPGPIVAPALLAMIAMLACRTAPAQSAPASARTAPQPVASHPQHSRASAGDRTRPGYTEADVRFMQGMIAHHAQALAMTSLVPERTSSSDIHLLAERIRVSQRDEIALMQSWLRKHGEEVPSADTIAHVDAAGDQENMSGMPGMNGHALMPGMLTHEQMLQLAHASGPDFDRLFLKFMIQHHEGALAMVGKLFGSEGAAQEPEMFRFANDVDTDQRIEIRRMSSMLEARQTG